MSWVTDDLEGCAICTEVRTIASINTYKEAGKGLSQKALNAELLKLKRDPETEWLGDCYSQVLQAATLNLVTAYRNFFAGRARFPRFKSKKNKQSIQYP